MDHQSDQCSRQRLEEYIASYAHIAQRHRRIDTNRDTTTRGSITDPKGRHAPAQLAPWTGGHDTLNDIFYALLTLLEEPHDRPSPMFPCRLHINKTGHELSVINSEAAVHLFDIDTIYKPAKNIIDSSLGRLAALRKAIAPIL